MHEVILTCARLSACPQFPHHNTIQFIYSSFIFSYLSFYFVYSHVQAKLSDLTKNDLIQLISHLEHEVGYRDSVINDMMVCLMSSHRHSIVLLLGLNIGWSCYTMISRRLVDNILPQVHPIWNLSGSTFTTPSLLYLLSITSHQQRSSPLVVCIISFALLLWILSVLRGNVSSGILDVTIYKETQSYIVRERFWWVLVWLLLSLAKACATTTIRHVIHTTFIVLYAFLMRQATPKL